ncbi:hypothetical protein PsorP6_008071 [Peronosclerospora sorghi]|uniref:Uncharacterized protein n=1 Tax=Peronosclerospora sorghi TaxID=230839 RepID=A0ACC0W7E5_9STRA|nr:hypothetical protein PsorP6_008071 [Peronosclerospora sorghi]
MFYQELAFDNLWVKMEFTQSMNSSCDLDDITSVPRIGTKLYSAKSSKYSLPNAMNIRFLSSNSKRAAFRCSRNSTILSFILSMLTPDLSIFFEIASFSRRRPSMFGKWLTPAKRFLAIPLFAIKSFTTVKSNKSCYEEEEMVSYVNRQSSCEETGLLPMCSGNV